MNLKLKIALYIAFTIGTCLFGALFFKEYNKVTNKPKQEESASDATDIVIPPAERQTGKDTSNVGLYGASFFASVLGLGLLAAYDIVSYFSHRAVKTLYDDEDGAPKNAEYDQAEEEWANGNHLDAIRLMREYLAKNPREQHVAIRIAEIYEKDLKNYLAAALEYEEVLKQKLPPQRWGWAAIHLCNLYNRLNKPDKVLELLRRIDAEYPETAAAEKARKRLAMIEGGELGNGVEEDSTSEGNQGGR